MFTERSMRKACNYLTMYSWDDDSWDASGRHRASGDKSSKLLHSKSRAGPLNARHVLAKAARLVAAARSSTGKK